MPLQSQLFRNDQKLKAAAEKDSAHIMRGARGEHVHKIQWALRALTPSILRLDGQYGPITAEAVKEYKNAPSRRIWGPGQKTADDIVGKRTMASLDEEMWELETRSRYVSLTEVGAPGEPHDHDHCPDSHFPGRDGLTHHFRTPINPRGPVRINIGGEGETAYLGFKDYTTDRILAGPRNRPLTDDIPPSTVSDICVRDSPITCEPADRPPGPQDGWRGELEINRIAMPGCRLTVAASTSYMSGSLLRFLGSVGRVVEDITMFDHNREVEQEIRVIVVEMRGDGIFLSQNGKAYHRGQKDYPPWLPPGRKPADWTK